MENNKFSKIAIKAVKEAGKVLNDNFQRFEIEKSLKGKSDIVTEIDLKSEKIILQLIKSNFPDHGILSEEAGSFVNFTSEYTWVIDPIDGTINYYHGIDPFMIGLCLLKNKKPIITAIYNPIKNHLYFAQKSRGATLNGKKIKVNSNEDLGNSVVMFHLSSKKEPRLKTINVLDSIFEKSMHMRMYGSALAQMSYIADGKFDVYFNIQTNPWDILPGALLVEEAGGRATDIKGIEVNYESTSILATNGRVHSKMLKLLKDI